MRKRSKTGRCLFATLALACAAGPARAPAQDNAGTTAAPILQLPLGARSVGMGTAFTAVADDVSALHYNPAGLSGLFARELSFMYLKGLEGQSVEYVAAATPLPFGGLIGSGYTSVGGSLLFSQNGSIEVNRTAPNGSLLSSSQISAGGDLVGTLGYSERIFEFDLETQRETFSVLQSAGLSGKFIRSSLAESYSATAVAADFGYHLSIPESGMSFGAALANLGSRMRFVDTGDPLPLTIRSGLAFSPALPETLSLPAEQKVIFAMDSDYVTFERRWHVNFGFEYSALRRYAFRLGYQFHRDLAGLSMGFGANWRGVFVDYAWALSDNLSDTHRFSFTYKFGRVPAYKREFRRRPYIESMPEREELRDIEQRQPETLETQPRRPRREIQQGEAPAGWIY